MEKLSKEERELLEKYREADINIQYAVGTLLKVSNVDDLARKNLEAQFNKYI